MWKNVYFCKMYKMKTMKRLIFTCLILCVSSLVALGQSEIDAYRFSQSEYEGTARFMGAGGAFSSVGAEFSAININPAAIGVYKKSEITFTPMVVSIFNDDVLYNGHSSQTSNVKYSLANAGGVFHFTLNTEGGWKSFQLGFGYNRTCDYNNIYRIQGSSNGTSRMDPLVDRLNAQYYTSLSGTAKLAYQTWMINEDEVAEEYWSPYYQKTVDQKLVVETSGANDEINISGGANYNDQLFLGACVGVPIISYNEKTRYTESDPLVSTYAEHYDIYETLRVRSAGVNLKIGVIYQPVNFLRIGAAFHTPSYFGKVDNRYYQEMTTYYDNGENSGVYSETVDSRYTLRTPFRAIGSLAFLIKKRAFISGEYEYTGYNMARMTDNTYDYVSENEAIQAKYGACHKVRVGAEVYITNAFLLRAGYNYRTSGYKAGVNSDVAHTASAGLGFRTKHFIFDLAYVFKTQSVNMWLYDADYVNASTVKTNTHRVVATIGCKF